MSGTSIRPSYEESEDSTGNSTRLRQTIYREDVLVAEFYVRCQKKESGFSRSDFRGLVGNPIARLCSLVVTRH